mmetsp:Transcript_2490/g.3668  ORF Transcript_2490/g.3668 Transcript_2490/m.3668 type:complete len:377 (-) Transcript_2490:160-1290(-)
MAKKKTKKTQSSRETKKPQETNDEKQVEIREQGSSQSAILIPSVFIAIIALLIGGGLHFHYNGSMEEVVRHSKVTDNNIEELETKQNISFEAVEASAIETPVVKKSLILSPLKKVDISLYHDIDANEGLKMNKDLLRYIQYDAGYAVCLDPKNFKDDNFGVLDLKKFKFQFLQKIASDPERWMAKLPEDALKLNSDEIMDKAKNIRSTCRLITLTHEDYDGAADRVIRDAVQSNETFYIPRLNAASEYRTMVCLLQLTDSYLSHAPALDHPAYENLRNAWALVAEKAREDAMSAPPRPMPTGWIETRDDKSGHTFYLNQKTGKTTWIRPVPRWGAKAIRKDPPPPAEGKQNQMASLISRKKPCDFNLTATLFPDSI